MPPRCSSTPISPCIRSRPAARASFRFFDPEPVEALRRELSYEQALCWRAIDKRPVRASITSRAWTWPAAHLLSMEALVRWSIRARPAAEGLHSAGRRNRPDRAAGRTGAGKVCEQLAQWSAQGLPVVPVSINVSPRQFNDSDITRGVSHAMARHGIPRAARDRSDRVVDDGRAATRSLESLSKIRALGIKLLVDDFGTGYSSLSQLQLLEMDVLKVDRPSPPSWAARPEGSVFFKAIVSMAHALGMRVVAEGVETEQQLAILRTLDCDEVQGYLISRPLGPDLIPPLLEKRFLLSAKAPAQGVLALARA
jgi:EAL domain-containing protein (putative c-di-GMP-specific phosphodiesterase class I)